MKPFKRRKVGQWIQPATGQSTNIQTWTTNTSGLLVPVSGNPNYQLQPINPWQPQAQTTTTPPTVQQWMDKLDQVTKKLPVRQQVETIIGYKRAKIVADPYRLFGVGMNAAYYAEDRAVCIANRGRVGHDPQTVPYPGCSCGFYAMPIEWLGKIAADYEAATADVQVELWGKVIRHEKGWRAEYQRVLGVWIDPVCCKCRRQADGLFKEQSRLGFVRAYCGWCSHDTTLVKRSRDRVETVELANRWGVEVRWGNLTF